MKPSLFGWDASSFTNVGGGLIAHLPTSLVCSVRNRKGDLFPIIILAMNSDCLDQEIVFFRRPGPADDFVRHDICMERCG